MAKKMNPSHKSLVAKVRKVNREAANWLRDEAPKMDSFIPASRLSYAFEWDASPQGHEYWSYIFEKIDGNW